eukprot:scaffold34_cov260-Pinguiococcus_pyrenoidosus.AAC.2
MTTLGSCVGCRTGPKQAADRCQDRGDSAEEGTHAKCGCATIPDSSAAEGHVSRRTGEIPVNTHERKMLAQTFSPSNAYLGGGTLGHIQAPCIPASLLGKH